MTCTWPSASPGFITVLLAGRDKRSFALVAIDEIRRVVGTIDGATLVLARNIKIETRASVADIDHQIAISAEKQSQLRRHKWSYAVDPPPERV